MAGVVPRLYQLLSNAVEGDGAAEAGQWRGGGDASTGVTVNTISDRIRAVLHSAPWLWVGDAFVPADQVRPL